MFTLMQPDFLRDIHKSYIQRVPTLREFWDLEKTVLHEIRVSGTVLWSPTNANSPTYMYISQNRTVNIYMYKTIEARVNTIAIPTTGKSCSLYWELLHPILPIEA